MKTLVTSIFTVLLFLSLIVTPRAQNLSGTYYIGAESDAPNQDRNYVSLKVASDELNNSVIEGNVEFLITGDLTETENVFTGVDTNGFTVTFKPNEGAEPVIEFTNTESNSDINGVWILGASGDSWDNLVHTENIIIDGSNTESGTSRDLTLTTGADAASNHGFRIVGSTNNIQFINSNIILQNSTFDGLMATSVGDEVEGSMVSKNLLIHNNFISNDTRSSARAVILRDVFDDITDDFPTITVSENDIIGRRYGIWVREDGGDSDIFGNNISVNEQNELSSQGILVDENVSEDNVVNIYNNTFSSLATNGEIYAIEVRGQGVTNIYNNFITGFEVNTDSAADDIYFYGILIRQPDDPDFEDNIQANVYHNTVYMNPVSYTGGEGWRYRGIQMNSNARISSDVRNNIVINDDQNENITSYALYRFGSSGSWNSDYNNVFATSPDVATETYLAYWDGDSATTLGEWTAASGNGQNSVSISVDFIDAENGDLRLENASIGEELLFATPVGNISTDIDGNDRDSADPYMGAHEPDDEATSNEDIVDAIPNKHQLNQNYPNPFNPTTTLNFELSISANVEMAVYNMLGQRVATLAEGSYSAGSHSVVWDASNVGSGIYIAQLKIGDTMLQQKMTLIK